MLVMIEKPVKMAINMNNILAARVVGVANKLPQLPEVAVHLIPNHPDCEPICVTSFDRLQDAEMFLDFLSQSWANDDDIFDAEEVRRSILPETPVVSLSAPVSRISNYGTEFVVSVFITCRYHYAR